MGEIIRTALKICEKLVIPGRSLVKEEEGPEVNKRVAWDDNNPAHLGLKRVRELICESVSLKVLGKMCKPDGPCRYMRKKGRGCKVHIRDFVQYIKNPLSDPKWAPAWLKWQQGSSAGARRLFGRCKSCKHEYPYNAQAPDTCPKCKEEVQKLTDEHGGKIGEVLEEKQREVMET